MNDVLRRTGNALPVALAALALLLGLAVVAGGPARGASDNTWDRLANCESGGNWKINTGNGYYGGLQFNKGTWRAWGGGKYASTPNRASRHEQITIAEKMVRSTGWGPWPHCTGKLGFTRAMAKAPWEGAIDAPSLKKPTRRLESKLAKRLLN